MKNVITLLVGILCTSLSYAQSVTYRESDQDFPNPERGFYRPLPAARDGEFAPLSVDELVNNRTVPDTPYQAKYKIRNTLVFRYYVLDAFREEGKDISSSYLDRIRDDLETIRAAGVKMIVRFAYTIEPGPDNTCEDKTACPPYNDASKDQVLRHIAQLKPIFRDYYDVIAVVQMGFIGIWGEQYYTDFFGDSSGNGGQGKLSDKNWQDRIEVLDALLAAVPESRMVQVRYPQIKQKAVGGVDATVTFPPVSAAQAHDGSKIARIGFHNDCFLAGPGDFGTYYDYGTDDTNAEEAIGALKPYFAEDSRYTVVGGETCSDGYDQNNCPGAVDEMAKLHYSYLNSEYNNAVNNDWQDEGCMGEIKRGLGYRLVMRQGTYSNRAASGGRLDVSLDVENVGFAAPYNPRRVELILRGTASEDVYRIPLTGDQADVRFWLPDESQPVTLTESLSLPDLPAGDYELLLNLPDTSNSDVIAQRPEYALRLANENTWEAATGFNKLNHTLTVTAAERPLATIVVDGADEDWSTIAPLAAAGEEEISLKAYHNTDYLYLLVQASTGVNNQFYLDTDNRSSTGYGDDAQWSAMGADYLIENGTLFSYVGDGTSFAWEAIVDPELAYTKTNERVELQIPRAALGDVAGTVRIGYAALDASYTSEGQWPASGEMAQYVLDDGPRSPMANQRRLEDPARAALKVYPNPGNDQVTVTFDVTHPGSVNVAVYTLAGQVEKTLVNEVRSAGSYSLSLDTQPLGTGVHIVRMQVNDQVMSRKLRVP